MKTGQKSVTIIQTTGNQKRLWLIQNFNPKDTQYNVCFCLELTGPVNPIEIKEAFERIINKHVSFKQGFLSADKAYIVSHVDIKFYYEDLSARSAHFDNAAMINEISQRNNIPFDLKEVGLTRTHLLRVGMEKYLLLFVAHHIITDAVSFGLVTQEFKDEYMQPSNMMADDSEMVLAYQKTINKADSNTLTPYWKKNIARMSRLDFPTDRPRTSENVVISEYLSELPLELISKVKEVSALHQTTYFKFLLACYVIVVSRYSMQESFVVGIPSHGRYDPKASKLVGFFVQLLPLCVSFDPSQSFRDFVQKITADLNEAIANPFLPYEHILAKLKNHRDGSHDSLFNNYFNMAITDTASETNLRNIRLRYFWSNTGDAHIDFGFFIHKIKDSYHLSIKYDRTIFEPTTISRLVQHWYDIIHSVLENHEQPIGSIPIKQPEIPLFESAIMAEENNSTILDMFLSHVVQTPQATAVISDMGKLSYQELHERSSEVAAQLSQRYGVSQGDIIALYFGHHPNLLVSVLAVLKCGAAYVSIDSNYPPQRVQHILTDSNAIALLSDEPSLLKLQKKASCFSWSGPRINIDTEFNTRQNKAETASYMTSIEPNYLAFIVYTSGTTGKPKGVQISHRGLLNLARAQQEIFNLTAKSRILQFAAVGFDAFASEWSTALYSGACLVFANKLLIGDLLSETITRFSVTHVTLPPSILQTISPSSARCLETVMSAGEACTASVMANWLGRVRLINGYGPSENSVCSTIFVMKEGYPPTTIGKAIDGTEAYVFDKYGNICPIGCMGEIYVGGAGLSKGYLNMPELTAQKFVDVKLSKGPRKLYKTGDLGKYLPDGNILFLGRQDLQIKLRGFRIEIEEIRSNIFKHEEISQVEVLLRETGNEPAYLVAFIVFKDGITQPQYTQSRLEAIEQSLTKQLPAYMVPEVFIVLESIYLTENNKVDREKLFARLDEQLSSDTVITGDSLETSLVRLFQKSLHIKQVPLKTSFFDLGGHSLSATHLVEKIKQHHYPDFKIADLFRYPSVFHLAKFLNNKSFTHSRIYPLSQSMSNKKIFCLHPIGGNVLCYQALAKKLKHKACLFGVPSSGFAEDEPIHSSIHDMAKFYYDEIKVLQPNGPYTLLGYCMGGLIAYELAKIFQDNADNIEKLYIIDTYTPNEVMQGANLVDEKAFIMTFLRMALITAGKSKQLDSYIEKIEQTPEPYHTLSDILYSEEIYSSKQSVENLQIMINILKINYNALTNYPLRCDDRNIEGCFVYAQKTLSALSHDKEAMFNMPILRNNKLITVPCDHEQIMLPEYLDYWIKACFED